MSRSLIKRGENKGFTLVEVMIAILVLSVALLALAGLQIVSIRGNSFGNHMTEALTLAKDLMEEMKNTEWEQIGNRSDDPMGVSSRIIYHRECTVTQSGNIKTVTVEVTWDNENHRVALVTKIADLRGNP
jgi:prepilin-type N-terminal cleavage/methylation domain-containing protein